MDFNAYYLRQDFADPGLKPDLGKDFKAKFDPDNAEIVYVATRDKKHLVSVNDAGWVQVWDRFPDGRPAGMIGSIHVNRFADLEES